MKNILISISAMIIWMAVIYTAIAYYVLQPNPLLWAQPHRLTFSVIGIICGVLVALWVYADIKIKQNFPPHEH